jgi:hypothetical protein
MELLYKAIIITSLIIFLGGLSYLITVGIVFICQLLVNAIFGLSYSYNVWLFGLLVWIIMIAFNSCKSNK